MCGSTDTIFCRLYANAQSVLAVAGIVGSRSELLMTINSNAYQAARLSALKNRHERMIAMLYAIAVVLLVLWLLGLVTSTTMGGFIHILLIIAIVVVLLRVISGRNPL